MSPLQKDTANAVDTLRPLNARYKAFQEEMSKRNATVDYEVTEVRAAQPRENTEPSQPLAAKMPPSSVVDVAPARIRAPKRCNKGCGHVYQRINGKPNALSVFHTGGICRLAGEDRYCAVVAERGYAGTTYKLDPDIDFDKEDQDKYHRTWVKSQHGCQYCQLGAKHPFPTTVEELEAERAGGAAGTNS